MNFYESVKLLDTDKNNISAVILSADNIGKRALWSDNELVYYDGNKDLWLNLGDEVHNSEDRSVLKLNNFSLYIEKLHRITELIICGGGHISIFLIKMAKMLGFTITVIEDRPKFANNARGAGADKVYCEQFDCALSNIKGGKDSYFVIVTRGHRHDQLCLQNIISKENAYIGMIGSKTRVKSVKENIINNGVSKELLDEIYSPIGLDIHAETPEEISVAIMAEIIKIKNRFKKGLGYSNEMINILLNKENSDEPKVMLTIIERKGSAPQGTGAKMVVFRDGTTFGTIGGGCLEAKLIMYAISCIDENINKIISYDMTGREAEDEGMVCGGIVKVLIENIS